MLFARPHSNQHQLQQQKHQQQAQGMAKVTCHGAGLVSGDADFKNSFTVFVEKGNIGGISVAFEGKCTCQDKSHLIHIYTDLIISFRTIEARDCLQRQQGW